MTSIRATGILSPVCQPMVMAFDQFPRWCSRALGSLDHCSNGQLADLLESNVQLEQFIDDLPEVGTTGITSSSCAPGLLAYSESHVLNTLCDNVGFQVISKLRNGIPCRGRGGISDRPVAKRLSYFSFLPWELYTYPTRPFSFCHHRGEHVMSRRGLPLV